VHGDDPEFGCRFIADKLVHEDGVKASENRVQRLCQQEGIASVIARRKGLSTHIKGSHRSRVVPVKGDADKTPGSGA
jgi:hypothetical protein